MDMTSVFISYRREDSRHQAGRLYDRLVAHFGSEQVFKDVDSIPLGLDFREVLTERVAGCDVFIAVIGDAWLSIAGKSGTRRLDDPGDFVRIEIEAALSRRIPVIPVLVGDSSVPQADELPESLRGLSFRNGLPVRPDPDFHNDMDRLIRGIEDVVSALRERSAPRGPRTQGSEDRKSADEKSSIEPRVRSSAAVKEPEQITNSIGMKLVLIPAGEFLMGSPDSDQYARDDEKPQHQVQITRPFYLGVTQVTQGQYRGVTGENPSLFKGSDDLPVEKVSWNDAIAFCNKLSELEGLKPYYQSGAGVPSGGDGYRLPTEAEWEYACRAGTTTRYSFGDDEASLAEFAWFDANSSGKTHPVGQKRPNTFGLYDMHGNVWEWCWDGFGKDFYRQSPVVDPAGPLQASSRVIRGGGWVNVPRSARSASRGGPAPDYRISYLGFRLARGQSGP
jgi:formylglycine-generating enzyme required for sulfatase activity